LSEHLHRTSLIPIEQAEVDARRRDVLVTEEVLDHAARDVGVIHDRRRGRSQCVGATLPPFEAAVPRSLGDPRGELNRPDSEQRSRHCPPWLRAEGEQLAAARALREVESRRHGLTARLVEAFEMAETEQASMSVIGNALAEILPERPAELLLRAARDMHRRKAERKASRAVPASLARTRDAQNP